MGQDNPAQGLIDRYKKWTGHEEKKPEPKKADTSWHDEQVKKANESFKKPAPSKAAADPKLGVKKKTTTAKKKPKKSAKRN